VVFWAGPGPAGVGGVQVFFHAGGVFRALRRAVGHVRWRLPQSPPLTLILASGAPVRRVAALMRGSMGRDTDLRPPGWYSMKNKETPDRERCYAVAGRVSLFLGGYQRKTCVAAVLKEPVMVVPLYHGRFT
jgi:hypothetical protein